VLLTIWRHGEAAPGRPDRERRLTDRGHADLRRGAAAFAPALQERGLALPDGREEIDPAFEAITALPVIEDGRATATVIMGELWGERAPTTTYADTIYAEIVLGAGGAIPLEEDADERAVMLVGGEASVDGHVLKEFELAVLQPGRDMTLESKSGARVMLLGGEAFETKRHAWWNFVSSSRERINQAKDDWREGRFPKVPGDEEEFIPLPEGAPKTVTYP